MEALVEALASRINASPFEPRAVIEALAEHYGCDAPRIAQEARTEALASVAPSEWMDTPPGQHGAQEDDLDRRLQEHLDALKAKAETPAPKLSGADIDELLGTPGDVDIDETEADAAMDAHLSEVERIDAQLAALGVRPGADLRTNPFEPWDADEPDADAINELLEAI